MEREYAEYLLKKTKRDYNLIAEDFSRMRAAPWEETRFLVDNYVISGEKILDLGCGNGRLFDFFNEKNVDYFGADNSEKLIEIAKNRYPKIKFQVADVLNLPFPDNYFDKIYAIALLHNIPSEEFRTRALKETKRILKENGLLILTTWNLWQRWRTKKIIYKFAFLKIFSKSKLDFGDILLDWEGTKDCYFHCFTKKELRKLVKRVDFNIIRDGEILVGLERKKRSKLPNSNFYIIAQK